MASPTSRAACRSLLWADRGTRRLALGARNRGAVLGIPRLILAYRTGAMRYGIFTLSKAGEHGAAGEGSNQR
ncbi:UNVERIFIED_ORG: hypothetical protein ABIB19_003062 [Arthrobacter sp. UYEF10]